MRFVTGRARCERVRTRYKVNVLIQKTELSVEVEKGCLMLNGDFMSMLAMHIDLIIIIPSVALLGYSMSSCCSGRDRNVI